MGDRAGSSPVTRIKITIRCDKECYWKGENLINMLYEEFLILIDYQQPSDEDILYVPINRDRGQNQKVYTFDYLGLMIWVWRKKIRTCLTVIDILADNIIKILKLFFLSLDFFRTSCIVRYFIKLGD